MKGPKMLKTISVLAFNGSNQNNPAKFQVFIYFWFGRNVLNFIFNILLEWSVFIRDALFGQISPTTVDNRPTDNRRTKR